MKNRLSLTLLVLALSTLKTTFAIPCQSNIGIDFIYPDSLEGITQMAIEREDWAASKFDVAISPCRKEVPSLREMENAYRSFFNSPVNSREVAGIEITDEPSELIDALEDLLVQKNYLDQIEKTADIASQVPSNCNKVRCAAEAIFGKGLGNKLLYLKTYGFNSSEFSFENRSRLTENEADNLVRSAQSFPKNFFPIVPNKQLTKFERGKMIASHSSSVIAFAAISFYDTWSEFSDEKMEYVAIHEMAHYIDREFEVSESPEWMELSGWVDEGYTPSGGIIQNASKKHSFCSHYAETNPAEDFAESLAAYRYNPDLLNAVSSDKYNFIKEHIFAGQEFTDNLQCGENEILDNLHKESISSANNIDQINMDELILKCSSIAYDLILNKPNSSYNFEKCISDKVLEDTTETVIQDYINSRSPAYDNNHTALLMLRNSLKNRMNHFTIDEKITNSAKSELKEKIVEKMFEPDSYRGNPKAPSGISSFLSNLRGSSKLEPEALTKVCKERWDEYSSQGLNIFDLSTRDTTSYRNREELQSFAHSACMTSTAQNGHLTKEQVENAFNHID